MSLEIRLLRESEYKAVNDLYNNTSHINRPAPIALRSYSDFCWEFINCPYGKAIYVGAWENEDGKEPVLVGIQCVILLKMITETGRQILSAKGEATLIDIKAMIKHKRTDILKELFDVLIKECYQRGIEFLWGFNNIPATYKRLGFENSFKSSHGILVLKPWKAFQNITSLKSTNSNMDNLKIALRTALSYMFSWKKIFIFSKRSNYTLNYELNENDSLFRSATLPDKMIFLLQDKNYLNWKISENPYNINYKSFQLLDEDKLLVAQIICSVQKDVAFIEQTLFDKKVKTKSRQLLLKTILQSLENDGVCLVRYTGFKSNRLNMDEMDLLKSIGFVFTGKGEWFTFKHLSATSSINPEKIYLSRMYKQGVN
jgi:hypothetical protein